MIIVVTKVNALECAREILNKVVEDAFGYKGKMGKLRWEFGNGVIKV